MSRIFPLSRNKFTPSNECLAGTAPCSKKTAEGYKRKLTKDTTTKYELVKWLESLGLFNFKWHPNFVEVELTVNVTERGYLTWLDEQNKKKENNNE